MTDTRLWDRASRLPVPANGRRGAELAALPPGLPTVEQLFTFMRDAETRFQTLRMRIDETSATTRGDHRTIIETTLRHPAEAKVVTSEPDRGVAGNYEIWVSDGETVRTYSAPNKLGTERPVRRSVVGLDDPDLPGMSTVYRPVTPLPMETLPDTFVHPAGYCQNVLATGACRVVEFGLVDDRETIVVECDHPRTIEMAADRPDFRIRLAADRLDGVILRLEESIGGAVTRDARVIEYAPDARLSPTAFDFTFPTGTTMLY